MAAKPDPDAMETTPAPEERSTTPATNGVNGEHSKGAEEETRPKPPPHRTPASPPAKPAIRPEDAEAFKAAGNKFYKAAQYGNAIDEYTKGKELSVVDQRHLLVSMRSADLDCLSQQLRPTHNHPPMSPTGRQHTWPRIDL
jgi:hypothetical protein